VNVHDFNTCKMTIHIKYVFNTEEQTCDTHPAALCLFQPRILPTI